MRILIACADDITRDLLARPLSVSGYSLTLTGELGETRRALQRTDHQVVLLAAQLPDGSGLDLCQEIRESEYDRHAFVAMLVPDRSVGQTFDCVAAGADAVLPIPCSIGQLIACIEAGEKILSLEMHEAALFAMAKLAESRDSDTGEHLERVRRFTRALTQELSRRARFRHKIDGEFSRLVTMTSPLHDIGKVGIPDRVLLKPGKLTPEEFALMRTHAVLGADTLAAAISRFPQARFLKMAREIAISHHEWWNGSGYPHRLVGDDIPLSGRIVAVADVYDALTSRRVYKDAYSHAEARQLIVDGCGTQFDPDVVEGFLRVEQDFRRIRSQLSSVDERPVDEVDGAMQPSSTTPLDASPVVASVALAGA